MAIAGWLVFQGLVLLGWAGWRAVRFFAALPRLCLRITPFRLLERVAPTLVMTAGGLRSTEVSPLKQIYQKQPVSRQADLVRLVLSIAEFR